MPVWVSVRKLLPLGTEILGPTERAGILIQSETAGLLYEWARRSDGGLLGWVTYHLSTDDDEWVRPVSHYVPVHLLRRRGPARRHQLGDYRPRTHG